MDAIVTESAGEIAYAEIRAKILDGELAGGTMVSEGTVAEELGMSRTPVREAFLRLQAEGWMRLYPKRGALVVEVRPHELQEIVEARVLIESEAVRRLARDSDRAAEIAERLGEAIERQRAAHADGDLSAMAEADTAFHVEIVDAGGNALLADFYRSLRDRQRRMLARSLWRRDDRFERTLADHELLARLIADGEADAFEVALARHIRDTHRDLLP